MLKNVKLTTTDPMGLFALTPRQTVGARKCNIVQSARADWANEGRPTDKIDGEAVIWLIT